MCGILGVIATRDPLPREAVERGARSLSHRGPDSFGIRLLRGGGVGCALAVARLRIIDLSEDADQPLSNEDGTVWLAYNGELYNFGELRVDLERGGHRFRSRTDTEVLAHLYEACDGDVERMLRRLRGMFAFALFDTMRGRLVLARDRLGIKPLYHAQLPDGGLAFGSEVRGLAATGLADTAPDPAALAGFLAWGVVPGPGTIFASVRSLPPAHYLVWEAGSHRIERWWSLRFDPELELADQGEAVRQVGAALEDAVGRHLIADRPSGVFLSGGIDSGAVATIASRAPGRIRALTVTFPDDAGFDEGRRAAEVAGRIGAEHVRVPVRGADVSAALPEMLRAMDQPTWDAVNSWVVCRAAHAEGLVVCLSGLGGDELFGGYESFRLTPRLAMLTGGMRLLPRGARRLAVRAASLRTPGGRVARALDAGSGLAGAYAAVRGLFSPTEVAMLLARNGIPSTRDAEPTAGAPQKGTAAERVGLFEMGRYLPDQLLRDTDTVSMAHSLEVRVPLLDDVVLNVAMAMPSDVRFAAGKRLLAEAAGVEFAREKRPFTLPLGAWTQGPLRDRLREGVLSDELPLNRELRSPERRRLWAAFEAGRAHWSRPWAVAVLRLWPVANGIRW